MTTVLHDQGFVGSWESDLLAVGVRPASLVFGLPGWLSGRDGVALTAFGDALVPAIALVCGLARQVAQPDPADPLWTLPTPADGRPFLAGYRGRPSQIDQIRDHLASDGVLTALEAHFRTSLDRAVVPSVAGDACRACLADLEQAFRALRSYLLVWRLSRDARPRLAYAEAEAPTSLWEEVDEAVRDAIAFLDETRPWPGSWEIRRHGLVWDDRRLVGSWFNRGIILRALWELGQDVGDEIIALLAEPGDDGIRTYGTWRGCPPDCDSMGLALDLASRIPFFNAEKADPWLAPLWASIEPDGRIPTWLPMGPGGSIMDGPPVRFLGNSCTGALLGAVWGLVSFWGYGEWDEVRTRLVRRNVDAILACWDGRTFAGTWFYDSSWSELMFMRLATRLDGPEIRRVRDALVSTLAATQRPDGSWGSPQCTAFRLHALALHDALPVQRAYAARFLHENRRADGAWNAEPHSRTPGPGRGEGDAWVVGIELTTALCASALGTARRLAAS